MAEDSKAMTTRESVAMTHTGLEPQNFEQAWRMAGLLAASDLVPKDYKGKPENCLVAMQMGRELGIAMMQAIQNIAVINGRPSIWGDLGLALIQGHPEFQDIEESFEGEGDNLTAVCTIKRRGRSPVTRQFSVEDAKAAQLWGKAGPWQQYKRRMLQMRARWWASRDSFADALKGISAAEEVIDLPPVEVPGATALGLAATLAEREPLPEVTGEAVPEGILTTEPAKSPMKARKEPEGSGQAQPPPAQGAQAGAQESAKAAGSEEYQPAPGRSVSGEAIEKLFVQAKTEKHITNTKRLWDNSAARLTEDDGIALGAAMEEAVARLEGGAA